MINVRLASGDKGSDVYTFEKGGVAGENILVLTRGVKGWSLEVPKTTILETSSDMRQIVELAEALTRVAQLVETDGFNKANIRVLPPKNQVQINTVGTAMKSAPEAKVKKEKKEKKAKK